MPTYRIIPGADPTLLRSQISTALGVASAGMQINYADVKPEAVGVYIPGNLTSQQITDLDAAIAGHENPAPRASIHWSQITGIPDLGGGGLPAGVIVMWSGTLASVPAGWALCDGQNGRPDLRDKFIKGWANGVNPGETGGAATHTHGVTSNVTVADHASHTHTYTEVPNHVHPLATGTGATGNFAQVIGTVDTSSGGTGATPTQTALGTRSGNPVGGVAAGTTAGPSATLTHAVTNNAVNSAPASSEPVYFKLAFIIKV